MCETSHVALCYITTRAVIHPCRTSSPADMAERRRTFCMCCWFFTGPTCCYRPHVAHSTCLTGCMSFSTRVVHSWNPTCSKAAAKVWGLDVNTLKLSVNLKTGCWHISQKWKCTSAPRPHRAPRIYCALSYQCCVKSQAARGGSSGGN